MKKSVQELREVMYAPGPKSGERYRHKASGAEYVVIDRAIDEATLGPVVVYGVEDDLIWVRPLASFVERFERTTDD